MDAAREARTRKKKELLAQLTELMIEEQVEEGVFLETPHYSVIEQAAVNLGRELSCKAQERGAREIAANSELEAPCPTCDTLCPVETGERDVRSVDGPVSLTEAVCDCPKCRRSFFPSASGDGNG